MRKENNKTVAISIPRKLWKRVGIGKNIEKVSRVLVGYNNRRNARENAIQMECDIRLERLEDGERKI